MVLQLYNTLTRRKEAFTPQDVAHVRMYVCGPTVYDKPHIGNARSVVVYDVLFRLLSQLYPNVTYVRNITDVDDKINAAAKARGISIGELTQEVTAQFHADMAALNVLAPTREPKATEHISHIIALIQRLIDTGNAYAASHHVLFSVASDAHYGILSRRSRDDMIAGSRVEVAPYKKDPADFVLWKPADAEDGSSSVFDSPWGKGRPGWHIECSAMSLAHLGQDFDIHGGGADLMFPHHENEIAQSTCAYPGSHFATYWVHNGFLTVNGEKMSKSLGNFITVRDLLDKGIKGEVIRLALLMTKYSEPLDWNENLLHSAKTILDAAYRALLRVKEISIQDKIDEEKVKEMLPQQAMFNFLCADLNTPAAISIVPNYTAIINKWLDIGENKAAIEKIAERFRNAMQLLGILQEDPTQWFKGQTDDASIQEQITARRAAKTAKNYAEADRIRKMLLDQGIILEDRPDGSTDWRKT